MTKDELLKRLVKIEATPVKNIPAPRDSVRRELNTTIESADDEDNIFNSFIDFQPELEEVAPARVQAENVNKVSENEVDDNETFFLLDETESDGRSGNPESFFTFDEEKEEEISQKNETTITEYNSEITIESTSLQGSSLKKLEDDVQLNLEVTLDKNLEVEKSLVNNFKICKYVKEDGENCKRQAPKNAEYCSSHRKLLAKQEEK